MAASLDDTARNIKILPRTDPLQLQEGMYRPLQVHQGCTQLHCIMCMFGRLLGAIRHLDIYASVLHVSVCTIHVSEVTDLTVLLAYSLCSVHIKNESAADNHNIPNDSTEL